MAKTFVMVFGWVFIVLGVLGFFGNPLVGPEGLFMADTAHNLVHLISGIIFLWVAYGAPAKSAGLLKVFGIIYLLVAILSFFSSTGSILGLFMSNTADNWLHLVMAVLFLWGGFSKSSDSSAYMGGGM